MIITCPHCQTKYQVTHAAIGSAGRKVQCAHCQEAWQQAPLEPEPLPSSMESEKLVQAITEDGLDEALVAEEQAVAKELSERLARERTSTAHPAGRVDPAIIRQRQKAFTRRQSAVLAKLPLARLRRAARVIGVLTLCAMGATFYLGRAQLVERYPAMAGVYAAIGLGVNVVGLDFANVTTLHTLRDGKDVLIVSAQILGLEPSPVTVPPVVISLINSDGAEVYQWSVTPTIRDLMAGERDSFETRLTLPPGDAARVKLSFAAAGARAPMATPAVATQPNPAAPVTAELGPTATPPSDPLPPEHP